jgi:hypothetical protein
MLVREISEFKEAHRSVPGKRRLKKFLAPLFTDKNAPRLERFCW